MLIIIIIITYLLAYSVMIATQTMMSTINPFMNNFTTSPITTPVVSVTVNRCSEIAKRRRRRRAATAVGVTEGSSTTILGQQDFTPAGQAPEGHHSNLRRTDKIGPQPTPSGLGAATLGGSEGLHPKPPQTGRGLGDIRL